MALANPYNSPFIDKVNNYTNGIDTNGRGTFYTLLKPQYAKNNQSYQTFKGSDGKYYYKSGTSYIEITNKTALDKIKANTTKNITVEEPGVNTKPTTNTNTTTTNTNTKPATSGGGSSGSGGGGSSGSGGGGSSGSGGVNNSYYEKLIKEYRDKIDALEHPKIWTAEELAEKHGVQDQYDYDKILQMYNDKTNKYYQDAVANQMRNNANAERSNSVFANSLINNYLSSYNSAAPTAVGKGTRAANALSSNIYADLTNEEASSNLQSIINTYLEKQKDELANNPILARQQYNDMGKLLLQLGASYNTAEVQNYINELNAYDTAYAGIRNAQNNLASTAAAAYQNNASAALANNTYNNNNAMAKYYQAYYGNENNNWQKAYQNMLRDQAISTDVNTSAN